MNTYIYNWRTVVKRVDNRTLGDVARQSARKVPKYDKARVGRVRQA